MLIKLGTWARLEFKMQDKVTKEVMCRLKSGNACYHSVQNLLSSRLLSPNNDLDKKNYNFACSFLWM
jgi:hypothetical protein